MSKVWRSRRIKFTLALVVAVVAGSCSGPQKQPVNTVSHGKKRAAPPQPRISPPVSNQAYPEARFETTSKTILSVPLDAFPQLPDAISSTLRRRECTIPQPGSTGAPRNVIHGDFFVQGQT